MIKHITAEQTGSYLQLNRGNTVNENQPIAEQTTGYDCPSQLNSREKPGKAEKGIVILLDTIQ